MRTEYQPPADVLAQIHAFLEANPEFFKAKRRSAARQREESVRAVNPGPFSPADFAKMVSPTAPSFIFDVQPKDDGSVLIDRYVDVRGSAGPGAVAPDEAIVKVRVDAKLLRERVGSNFSHIKMAGVSGDSMEPTLSHGDQVLVDTSVTRFRDNAIYAIQQDGFLRFKRVKLKLDGAVIVKSDAAPDDVETYTAEEAAHFYVIGEVIPFKFGRFKV